MSEWIVRFSAAGSQERPVMSSRLKILGSVFSMLALAGTVSATVGTCLAYVQRAPAWAFFLFFGIFLSNIPLGGVIGFVFRLPDRDRTGQPEG